MIEHLKVDNINRFMKDIEQYPRLTREQEYELWEQMHGDDPVKADKAREKFICCNLRLVVSLSHQYKKYASLSDLCQEGALGLITAVDKFDPNINPRASIAITWWVKQSLRRYVLNKMRTVRIPGGMAQRAARIAKIRQRYEFNEHRAPTTTEIADELGISEQRVESNKIADVTFCSLDEPVNEDADTTYEDMLLETIDDTDDTPEDMSDAIHDIRRLINKLPARDKFILEYSYGIGCTPQPVEIIAQETGMYPRCINGRLHTLYRHLHAVMTDKKYSF